MVLGVLRHTLLNVSVSGRGAARRFRENPA
jgi:hypothetical protein